MKVSYWPSFHLFHDCSCFSYHFHWVLSNNFGYFNHLTNANVQNPANAKQYWVSKIVYNARLSHPVSFSRKEVMKYWKRAMYEISANGAWCFASQYCADIPKWFIHSLTPSRKKSQQKRVKNRENKQDLRCRLRLVLVYFSVF